MRDEKAFSEFVRTCVLENWQVISSVKIIEASSCFEALSAGIILMLLNSFFAFFHEKWLCVKRLTL